MIVAIDGPAGSGKSTVARAVARDRGFTYIDTGAMYRSVALMAAEQGIAFDDAEALRQLAQDLDISFVWTDDDTQQVFVNGRDVTTDIRTPRIDTAVSPVSSVAEVREVMVDLQRQLAESANVVAEGRDIGTTVFPDAEVKIFLTASSEVRAHRRALQNQARMEGMPDAESATDESRILAALIERDRYDSSRAVSPLAKAPDAVVIDSDDMSIEEVCDAIERLILDAKASERGSQ